MLTDDMLSNELRAMAETPAPPMRLDIDQARIKGRRVKRRRIAAVATVCTAVAVAVAVVIPVALRGDADLDRRPADPVVPPQTEHLLVARATFGWLPDGVSGISVDDNEEWIDTAARWPGELGMHAWLRVHPVSDTPPDLGKGRVRPLYLVSAQPVNGRPAYWATESKKDPLNRGDMHLVWQAANGQWVDLNVYYATFGDQATVMHRIAADVTVGIAPIAVPIRIDGLPSAFDNADLSLTRPGLLRPGAWELGMSYWIEGALINIGVMPAGLAPLAKSGNETRACKTADGVQVCVSHTYAPSPDLESIGGVQGLLDKITPLGMDESKWTTDPIN
jgi:hypothetical protein